MKRIILEGPDGIGKTTQVDFLRQLLNIEKINSYTNKETNTYDYWFNEYTKASYNNSFIHSRSFLSERLYADIYNRIPRITEEEEVDLLNYITLLGFDIFILLPYNIENLIQRLTLRGDHPLVLTNIELIVDRYKQLAKKYKIKILYI